MDEDTKTPVSETKSLLPHSPASNMDISVMALCFRALMPQGSGERARGGDSWSRCEVHYGRRAPSVENINLCKGQ